jgi:2-dehydropantoate 2-reductase
MRFILYGAGAIGGVIGGRLHQGGHDVVLIARGAHLDAIESSGLRLLSPHDDETMKIAAAGDPAGIEWADGDVVLLCMKSQDTAGAVTRLAACAPPSTTVVCTQNAVENERVALRSFERVYGICVMCPTSHLEPGVVIAHSTPTSGILDIGRWPSGVDDTTAAISEALRASTFESEPVADIARWKYTKLLMNLGNAVDACCGPEARFGELGAMAMAEGRAVLDAAGIVYASEEEDKARRADHLKMRPVGDGARWKGSSSWQSLERGTGTIEADYLNGEIALLGRLHGVPTPVNATMQRLANDLAARKAAPGSIDAGDVLRDLGHEVA